jgi:septum site-determining protein MinC
MAFVLVPALPMSQWLAQLDKWTRNSPDFFVGRPIILDLAGTALTGSEIGELITTLAARGIRVMGLEGADPDQPARRRLPGKCTVEFGRLKTGWDPATSRIAGPPPPREPTSLLIETPIRSGQSVVFPSGDVTVLGSVSSGAEIVAGGSIHVYGALRGRAMAGSTGNARARIFCTRNEAELISVDGYYRTDHTDVGTAQSTDAMLARGPRPLIAALIEPGRNQRGQSRRDHVGKGWRRQDNVYRSGAASHIPARRSRSSISMSGFATSTW